MIWHAIAIVFGVASTLAFIAAVPLLARKHR